ncbi:MAG: hypothetical protein WA045_11790 [Nitrospira sp.]
MFRIMFEPKTGTFKIQFIFWGLIWFDVKMQVEGGKHETRRFDTYDEARKWVNDSGIAKGFDEQQTKDRMVTYGSGSRSQYEEALG